MPRNKLQKFLKRNNALLKGAGIALAAMASTIGVFILVFWSINAIKNFIEKRIEERLVSELGKLQVTAQEKVGGESEEILSPILKSLEPFLPESIIGEPVPETFAPTENLTASTFTDLFSGVGWLNTEKTKMYQDRNVTAFTFPPKYVWREIEKNSAYDFSVKPLGLVGKVIKVGDTYKGLIYKTDGTPIFDETNTPIVSKYKGELGFGGSDNDWIFVYGAYESIAYRVVSGELKQNLSGFFGNRVMNGGFEPAILRSGLNWYVYSLTKNNPKLIKLFQNGTNEIKGALDFSPLFFLEKIKSAVFNKELMAKIEESSGEEKFYKFIDEGFDKRFRLAVVSANINNYPAEVRTAVISGADLANDGGEIKFYLSNDGERWLESAAGKEIVFPKKDGRRLIWRAEFLPDGNPETSPFFNAIYLNYGVKFL